MDANTIDFYEAQHPQTHVVLGLELLPLSAGHIDHLSAIESAFMVGGEANWDDLAASVFICSQSFEDAARAFRDPKLPRLMRKWHDRLTGADAWRCRLGLRKPRVINLGVECERFSAYVAEGFKVPGYKYDEGGGGVGDVPTTQYVKAFLLANTSMTEAEILNRSWRLSMWDYLSIQATKGHLQFMSTDTIAEAMDIGRRLAEKLRAQGIKVGGR